MKEYFVVTGGDKGIGLAIVKQFLRDGRSVIYTHCRPLVADEELTTLSREYQAECLVYQLDLLSYNQVEEFFRWTKDLNYQIGGIVNNAGISKDNLVVNMTVEDWDEVIRVNLYGTFYMCKVFSKALIEQRSGFFINIASTKGITGGAGASNYAASKGGLIAFTKSLGYELAKYGIKTYVIAPGYIDTDMIRNMGERKLSKIKESILLKRFGTGEEVAQLVSFLAEGSHYFQNALIRMDGGLEC